MEHIIREDYLVEGLEITEMFLDLILARVGLINLSNEIDPGMKAGFIRSVNFYIGKI